ncbi:MAG: serine/threonine protein kinase [Pirellulaceae bacterium]|nr:MAG: serine/threonine protein kinase [Pirellulaceae bacterium]
MVVRPWSPFFSASVGISIPFAVLLSMAGHLGNYGAHRVVAAEGWTRFRGPTGQGIATDHQAPVHFSLHQGIVWKTPIEGTGWSSPVSDGRRIWLTTAIASPASEEEKQARLAGNQAGGPKELAGEVTFKAVCVDFQSGQIVHSITLGAETDPDPINPLNSYASPTPVVDEDRVYCDFGNYGTWCLDAETGEQVWHRQYDVDYSVGPGSSPVVVEDTLILVCDGIDQQFVVGLDKQTGQERWRTPRPPKRASNVEFRKAYSTPLVLRWQGEYQVVIPTAQWLCGYDPSTGQELWRFDHGDGFSVSPMAIQAGDLLVFSTGFMRPELVAVRWGDDGVVSEHEEVWRQSRGAPTKPSPLPIGPWIYVVSDRGILSQLDAQTGEIRWQQRLGGNYSASPVLVGNHLYLCSHEGEVIVVGVGPEYVEVARNELEPRLMASPAIVDENLIIRSEKHLFRIGEK